mmetsp:Transcript_23789/g.32732  ORF Transcript_23789/g.32732 Transcript_23789/m.32732 type:complete len:151 (-) Transcript_23789:14-466(-)
MNGQLVNCDISRKKDLVTFQNHVGALETDMAVLQENIYKRIESEELTRNNELKTFASQMQTSVADVHNIFRDEKSKQCESKAQVMSVVEKLTAVMEDKFTESKNLNDVLVKAPIEVVAMNIKDTPNTKSSSVSKLAYASGYVAGYNWQEY